ncbi:DUF805 domain-containing protein [Roseibium sediminicola]|uniref:DUF805 domain-containing protein n=1 Tax=Roseibium sediminicola TaxID=2933272 RepID=A0ABT0GSH6_9HYPH|nr:DUF805 domain-containing protein [Roseibium sp. CAU 1639]MCK7612399.1 DUF805 domain-containing protein [Roseibium sp. CAU 1639]
MGVNTGKTVWNYFVTCLWEKHFDSKGRASRREFWSFFLCVSVLILLVLLICFVELVSGYTWNVRDEHELPIISMVLGGVVSIGTTSASKNVAIRRLHDWNKSSKYMFLCLLPYLGFLLLPLLPPLLGSGNVIGVLVFFGTITVLSFAVFAFLMSVAPTKGPNKYGPPTDDEQSSSGLIGVFE